MKRLVLTLLGCALAVALTATAAFANGQERRAHASGRSIVRVAGIITSVDSSADSFKADASVQSDDAQGSDDQGEDSQSTSADEQGGDTQSASADEQGGDTQSANADEQGGDTQSASADDQSGDSQSTSGGDESGDSQSTSADDQGEDSQSAASDDQGEDSESAGSDDQGEDTQGGDDQGDTAETITVSPAATVAFDGKNVAFSRLRPGDHFVALYSGTRHQSLEQLVAGRALAVYAHHSTHHRSNRMLARK